jgi:hypothetical protein
MQALGRDEWPFDLHAGDVVTLEDGRVGVTVRIYCGDMWIVRLVDGTDVRVRRPDLTWTGQTDGLPIRFRR